MKVRKFQREVGRRAAIYARMSTDKQSADSPADQVARCREYAEGEGLCVIEDLVRTDAGISGASRHNRPSLLELMARIDEWDVLLCFDSSRLARNGEDLGWILNRLRLHRRRAVEVAKGLELDNVASKVMGVLNEEYLAKLRLDTHRGLRGRVERRLAPGGLPYGYASERLEAGSRIVVVPERAAVVRRIFGFYSSGVGLRSIAHDLNAEGIPAPRGKGWAPSALREILRNRLYVGEYVWNRSEWIKDHETGRRRRFERPEREWVIQRDESWRIISADVWSAVQDQFALRSSQEARSRAGGRATARHPLSGCLECGECGGGFHALSSRERYGCGWGRDRGPKVCGSTLRVDRLALEERIFGALRLSVLTPENVRYAVRRTLEELRRMAGADLQEGGHRRLAQIEVEIERAVEIAVQTGGLEAATRKLDALRAEQEEIRARLAGTPMSLPAFGDLEPLIEARVADFRAAFEADPATMRRALRALLGDRRIVVREDRDRGFAVEGWLSLPLMQQTPGVSQDSGRLQRVVAGVRYTPNPSWTCRSGSPREVRASASRVSRRPDGLPRWEVLPAAAARPAAEPAGPAAAGQGARAPGVSSRVPPTGSRRPRRSARPGSPCGGPGTRRRTG
jgi:site-specific DNA recombinase